MATLALGDQRKVWQVQHWNLPELDVWFFLVADQRSGKSNLQSRFAVWGLEYGIFGITLREKYYVTVMRLIWQGEPVGNITIENIPQPMDLQRIPSGIATQSLASSQAFSGSNVLNTTSNYASFSDLGEGFQVFYNYDGADIDSSEVFTTIVSAMRVCADEGEDSRCPELEFSGWHECEFLVRSEKDKYGNSLLRYRHVIKMLQKLAFKMAENEKFGAMTFVLEVNGGKVAQGTIRQWKPRSISR